MSKPKIDERIILVTELLLNCEQGSDEQKALMDELRLFQTISKSWQITESTYIPDNNLLTHLSNLTQTILQDREESFWANPYLDEAKSILEICKTWLEAGVINSNSDYVIDDGSKAIEQSNLAHKLKTNFYEFLLYFWDVIIHNEIVPNWHVKYLCDEMQIIGLCIINRVDAPHNLVINIPPTSSKSTIVSVMFNAWIWASNPTLRVISSSHTAELAVRDAVLTRDIVTSSKYRQLFPNVQLRHDSAAKHFFKTTEGGFRYTTSTNSTPTGHHADIRLIDDPLGKTQSRSEADRNAAIEHVKALATRVVEPNKFTPTVMVMQRLHPEDPTAWYLGLNLKTKHICLPAELSDLVSPNELKPNYIDGLLDPIRLSAEVLDTRRKELGADGFGGEYSQDPQLGAGLLYEEFRTYEIIPREEYMYRYCTIDTADQGKDDLCAIIADDRVSGVYLIDVFVSDKSSEYTIPIIADMLTKYKVDEVKIEKNAAGRLYSVELERQLRLRQNFTTKVRTFWSKENKETRIYINAPEVHNNTWMPIGWKSMWPEFANQIINRQKAGIHSKDDCCFAAGTKIKTIFGDKNIENMKIGDVVITPIGIRRVIDCGITGNRNIISKYGLTATSEHKVFNKNDVLFDTFTCINKKEYLSLYKLKELLSWRYRKVLFLMELNIDSWGRESIISLNQLKLMNEKKRKDFMLRFGSFISEKQYRKAIAFIIKMATALIMTLLIWSVSKGANMLRNIQKRCLKMIIIEKDNLNIYQKLGIRHQNGIEVQKEENGIVKMQKEGYLKRKFLRVKNVVLRLKHLCQMRCSVVKSVVINIDENKKVNVYNLTVENAGCYYANNVLVSNCDNLTNLHLYRTFKRQKSINAENIKSILGLL